MRTLSTLAAAAIIGTAAVATPTPAPAAAPWVIPVIIAAVVVGTVVVAQAAQQNKGTIAVVAPAGKAKAAAHKKKK